MVFTILLTLATGWLITEFEPLQFTLSYINNKLPKNALLNYIRGAFTCWQCMTFWFGMIAFGFEIAVVSSFITYLITAWTNKN